MNAEGDAAQQQAQAEQAIADGAGVILLVSLDTGSGAAIIDQAKEAGVKVVEYDRFNTGGSGGDVYVSFDNVAVGAAMAEALTPVIDGLEADPKRVVMLNGGEEDNNSFLFRTGYAETVEAKADAGEWEIVADQHVPAWDNAEAQTLMEQILVDADNDVDAVFAANDGLGNSAANALEAAGIEGAPVSGQDASAAGIQNIALGRQTMTVYKPIQAEADVAAKAALALCAGEDPTAITSDFEFETIGIQAADGNPADSADGRRRRPVPGADADPGDDRQHHGHRDRRRVPDDRGDLHRRRRRDGVLPGERLIRPRGSEGGASGRPLPPPDVG